MTTDTTERGLERLICTALTGQPCDTGTTGVHFVPNGAGAGWIGGAPGDYNRSHCLDLHQLAAFLADTQPEIAEALDLATESPRRLKFLSRLEGEITRRGVVDVLRHGVKEGQHDVALFYGTPSAGNAAAAERYARNRFSVTRQLRYSNDETQRSLDMALFINGLPVATFELKNSLTKQTVEDAVLQYKRDRNPKEKLFALGRCAVHFAVDEHLVRFCTHLKGEDSWFLPFDKGWNDGAGNPPNPDGLKTAYLWKEIVTREGLTEILENYAQMVEQKEEKTGKKTKVQIWPRYHQRDVVRRLLADAARNGAGRRYLIQHSAGSGKSNSIAWLAHQLIGLRKDDADVFDSIIIVTDRRILDKQIRDTIKGFAQVKSTVGHAEHSGDLRRFIESGKKIIITTVQKFPFITEEIGDAQRGRSFAIVIDEAHSSQGGKTSAAISTALSEAGAVEDEETIEDTINRVMESRKLLTNASYFAFTATPKNKTLEIFGEPYDAGGVTKHRPFHSYTMKQAIEEGFILDVLRHYTPVASYYKLIKKVEEDPEFDTKRARGKLRRYVESHEHAIRLKAEIMVDHFHDHVLTPKKIGGEARAMVVTNGIERAIQYYHAIRDYLVERKSPYKAIVAFSGEHDYGGAKVTEATLNGFASSRIAETIREEPYRFLICADKFQTGYDEPLLHTMYVDKTLSGIKAVQTLSRLNRSHPKKHDTFVLDFMNDAETIEKAFADYYRTTILSEETDPNKLHDLKSALDGFQVYGQAEIDTLVELYLNGADRDKLDPILDACVAEYVDRLDEDQQVEFKGKAKAFTRTYGFLSSILDYTNADWEKLSIFLTFLVPKLPAPVEHDLSRGILEAIDMDSYRVEKKAMMSITLADADAEIDPVPPSGGGYTVEPELEKLSQIIHEFNQLYGSGVEWEDNDRIKRFFDEDLPKDVTAHKAYQNAMNNSDEQNARIELEKAMNDIMVDVMNTHTDLFKLYSDDESFRRMLLDKMFQMTYRPGQR